MDRIMSLGVLATCAGLAACGGSSTSFVGPTPGVPTLGLLDSALPFGATNGQTVQMLSSDRSGVSDTLATIAFNDDGSLSVVLPSGGAPIIITSAAIAAASPAGNADLGTTSASFPVGDYDVEVHLGESDVGTDLFILTKIEDGFVTPNPLAFVVFGDETAAPLPAGTAVGYTGGFTSEVLNASGDSIGTTISGTTTITANFDGNSVGMTFNQTGESSNATFTGTATVSGSRYTGSFSSTGGVTSFDTGTVSGAFYGSGAEATAGVFQGVDTRTADPTDDLVIVGGFTGFLD